MMFTSNGLPVSNTLGFPQVAEPRTMPVVQGNRFGVVPSPAAPWQQPQINGVPAAGVPGTQQYARAPFLPSNASPFPQQYSRPPSSSADAGPQASMIPPMLVGPPPAVRASTVQV